MDWLAQVVPRSFQPTWGLSPPPVSSGDPCVPTTIHLLSCLHGHLSPVDGTEVQLWFQACPFWHQVLGGTAGPGPMGWHVGQAAPSLCLQIPWGVHAD